MNINPETLTDEERSELYELITNSGSALMGVISLLPTDEYRDKVAKAQYTVIVALMTFIGARMNRPFTELLKDALDTVNADPAIATDTILDAEEIV